MTLETMIKELKTLSTQERRTLIIAILDTLIDDRRSSKRSAFEISVLGETNDDLRKTQTDEVRDTRS